MHSLAISRHHKQHHLKTHIFEVNSTLDHRTSFDVFLNDPVNYDELLVIVCYTWDALEYFALIVPGTINPLLLPDYPTMPLDILESIILPYEYRFQVREYIHEGKQQPILTDFKDKTYFHKHAKQPRRRSRSLGCRNIV